MFTNQIYRRIFLSTFALMAVLALASCAVNLPPSPASNPASPQAAEAATRPMRPTLVATSRTFLSPSADDREQKAKQMDHSAMAHGSMQGMSHAAPATPPTARTSAPTIDIYTCPMHPEIRETQPGNCPSCGMTLIKASASKEGAKP